MKRTSTMRKDSHTLFSVLEKIPETRAEFECQQFVPWFRNKSILFRSLKPEIVADVIRHCDYERKKKDDVLIKQGDSGDRLYIILRGSVSVYVIHDQKDNPAEVLKQVNTACSAHDFDRSELGQYVWTGGEGKCFGEVALLKEDCIRTATVVADGDTDLVIIDRNLYNRSVKDVLEMEYQLKTKFVEENSLFKNWPSKQKKLLVVALKKESAKYGSYLLRQGNIADHMYFLLSGEIEITCDQSQFKRQYSDLWREMETLLPGLLPRRHSETPHERLKRKKVQRKVLQMCLLGSNESVGEYFAYLIKSNESVLVDSYDILKILTFLLQDDSAVDDLRKKKRREREIKKGLIHNLDDDDDSDKKSAKEAEQISGMMKMLDMNPKTTHGRLPTVESSQRVINEIEAGLRNWIETTRGGGSPIPTQQNHLSVAGVGRRKSFQEDFMKPIFHQTASLSRPKTPTK
ncbi:uncharacterized protein LOC123553732 [Mercenaria mercenaria]|uniref:uncharacterized protein LOC123553732 n=1 Tax=Mercenaria mercenaria TaxID=6596 RepID=UPI00234E7760|nr:uncharacterized protein LOC123553732 [Mercenaria mercenaria]